jgi:NifU-like protein involved in Fe-S cluster formation
VDTAIDAVTRAVRHLRQVGGRVPRVRESLAPQEQPSGYRPPDYNDLTWRHFSGAAYAGVLQGPAVHRGAAGSPQQGTWVQFDLQIGGSGTPTVQNARFQAYGCPHVIAVADWLAQGAVGQEAAAALSHGRLPESVRALRERFGMPIEKLGRLLLIEDAWREAVSSLYVA